MARKTHPAVVLPADLQRASVSLPQSSLRREKRSHARLHRLCLLPLGLKERVRPPRPPPSPSPSLLRRRWSLSTPQTITQILTVGPQGVVFADQQREGAGQQKPQNYPRAWPLAHTRGVRPAVYLLCASCLREMASLVLRVDVRVYTFSETRHGCWCTLARVITEGINLAPPKSTWNNHTQEEAGT